MRNNSSEIATASCSRNHWMEVMATLLPIAIAIFVTNTVVFILFYTQKSLRTSSNCILLGLAVCDFLTGTISIPYFLVYLSGVIPDSMFYDFAVWMPIQERALAISTCYHILLITAEKYMAIMTPLRHQLVTKKTIFKCLAGIWLVSGFIATIQLALTGNSVHIGYSATCLIILFLIPYTFMMYAYTVMFKRVRHRMRPPSRSMKDNLRYKKGNRRDFKCILVFAIMAAMYFCCWFPYYTFRFAVFIKLIIEDGPVFCKFAKIMAVFRYTNSITNPLLYTFFKRDFWLSLRSLSSFKKHASYSASKRSTTLQAISRSSRSRYSNTSLLLRNRGKGNHNQEQRDSFNMEDREAISSV